MAVSTTAAPASATMVAVAPAAAATTDSVPVAPAVVAAAPVKEAAVAAPAPAAVQARPAVAPAGARVLQVRHGVLACAVVDSGASTRVLQQLHLLVHRRHRSPLLKRELLRAAAAAAAARARDGIDRVCPQIKGLLLDYVASDARADHASMHACLWRTVVQHRAAAALVGLRHSTCHP